MREIFRQVYDITWSGRGSRWKEIVKQVDDTTWSWGGSRGKEFVERCNDRERLSDLDPYF